jgi:fluoride exporter
MVLALVVGAAGAVGAVARYLLDGLVQDRTSGSFPAGTLAVNLSGSFVLGVVTGFALHHPALHFTAAVVGAGFCGAFTTWSTTSWETVRLAEEGDGRTALTQLAANIAGCLATAGLGLAVGWH